MPKKISRETSGVVRKLRCTTSVAHDACSVDVGYRTGCQVAGVVRVVDGVLHHWGGQAVGCLGRAERDLTIWLVLEHAGASHHAVQLLQHTPGSTYHEIRTSMHKSRILH